MTDQIPLSQPHLTEEDKLTPLMIYTSHSLIWGQVFSKQAIRVSSWMRTDMAPDYMKLHNAQMLAVGGSQALAPVKIPVLHLQTSNINAYHLMPPASEAPDFDPNEPNRKMVPLTAYVGYFRFDGFARMAEISNIDNFLSAAKSDFIALYDFTMSCPMIPSIKGVKAPMLLIRQGRVSFSTEEW